MKFICAQQELVSRTNIVSKAVPSKTTMSILQYIYIDASQDTIRFIANDMENGIETTVEGSVVEEGYAAIEAGLFSSIVRTLPASEVTVSVDDNCMVSVDCESTHFTLPGRSGDDFTFPPEVEQSSGVEIPQATLKNFITQTAFSISTNDANKIMTGELLEIEGDTLKLVSLDGHRISMRRCTLDKSYDHHKAIIPGRTMTKVRDILSDSGDKTLTIYFTDKHVCFVLEDTLFVSRLIDGEYFDIAQMMQGNYETKVTLNRRQLMEGIERAMTLSQEGDKKPIILGVTDDDMELKVSSTRGSMNSSVPIAKEGKDILIGFNPKFLTDAMRAIDDEDLTLFFVNPKAPCFIRNEDESYVYMILPINFKNID